MVDYALPAGMQTYDNLLYWANPILADIDARLGLGATVTYVDAQNALDLKKASNLSDLASPSTARTNLGLSANGSSLVTAANYAAMRVLLGLGAVALLGTVTEADQTLADNTTNNASTAKHGYVPKLPNDATKYFDGTGAFSVPAGGGGGSTTIVSPQGRLTLTSNTPIMGADVTGATTIYYAPHVGKTYPVFDGSAWAMRAFSQLSLILDTTSHLALKLFDVFIFNDAGTDRIGAGPAWKNTATITVTIATPAVVTWASHGLIEGSPVVFTNAGGALPTGITAGTTYYVSATSLAAGSFRISTTLANSAAGTNVATSGTQSGTHTGTNATTIRGTGAGTTEREFLDGVWTNKNAITLTNNSVTYSVPANRATWLGTFYTTANGQTSMQFEPAAAAGGNGTVLGLYNGYNQTWMAGKSRDTNGYTYGLTALRPADNSVNNRVWMVDGGGTSHLNLSIWGGVYNFGTNGFGGSFSQCRNSTTTTGYAGIGQDGPNFVNAGASETYPPALGLNYVQMTEKVTANVNKNFFNPTVMIGAMM